MNSFAPRTFSYCIDKSDRFIEACPNWFTFAREQAHSDYQQLETLAQMSLWDVIAGRETRHFYEIILEQVRSDGQTVTLPFNCDAPDTTRSLELTISAFDDGKVLFRSTMLNEANRQPAILLDTRYKRSHQFVRICSVCKRVAHQGDSWIDCASAIEKLGLFHSPHLPQLTHTVCPTCYAQTIDQLSAQQRFHQL